MNPINRLVVRKIEPSRCKLHQAQATLIAYYYDGKHDSFIFSPSGKKQLQAYVILYGCSRTCLAAQIHACEEIV